MRGEALGLLCLLCCTYGQAHCSCLLAPNNVPCSAAASPTGSREPRAGPSCALAPQSWAMRAGVAGTRGLVPTARGYLAHWRCCLAQARRVVRGQGRLLQRWAPATGLPGPRPANAAVARSPPKVQASIRLHPLQVLSTKSTHASLLVCSSLSISPPHLCVSRVPGRRAILHSASFNASSSVVVVRLFSPLSPRSRKQHLLNHSTTTPTVTSCPGRRLPSMTSSPKPLTYLQL